MTKRETGYSVLGLKVWATAGLMLILVLSSGPALAAQIDITNCTEDRVGICAFNNSLKTDFQQQHHLGVGDSGHFACHANCYFTIQKHNDGKGKHYSSKNLVNGTSCPE